MAGRRGGQHKGEEEEKHQEEDVICIVTNEVSTEGLNAI